MRPLCGPAGRRGGGKLQRYKHRLPRGIYINHDDLVAMATGPQPPHAHNQGEAMLRAMDREVVSLKRQVSAVPCRLVVQQTNKQHILITLHSEPSAVRLVAN